jgi:hypothetical protein
MCMNDYKTIYLFPGHQRQDFSQTFTEWLKETLLNVNQIILGKLQF